MKSIQLYHTESCNTEEWLYVNSDGTVTHERENSGWTMSRNGIGSREPVYSIEEAKKHWSSWSDKIDAAVAKLKSDPKSN
jgi:hypothetical protein